MQVPLGSARAGSNPARVAIFFCLGLRGESHNLSLIELSKPKDWPFVEVYHLFAFHQLGYLLFCCETRLYNILQRCKIVKFQNNIPNT